MAHEETRSTASDHARALATMGAAKGGEQRAKKLSSQDRSEIASRAAQARWGNVVPGATHTGQLVIAGTVIDCAVLENGKRLITQESFLKGIGRAGKAKAKTGSARLSEIDGLPPFLFAENLEPFISDELRRLATPLVFRSPTGARAFGYDAALLPEVCDVYLNARDAKKTLSSQKHIVERCDLLIRGFARVGIIALVDEATGYQEQRARDELNKILEKYVSEEMRPWVKTFPDEFFRQIYKLHGWTLKPGSTARTPQVGKLINQLIYEELPPGVLTELQVRNPMTSKGYRRHKHHQFLTTDTGNVHLDKQITAVTALMRASETKEEFEMLFKRFSRKTYQARLPLEVPVT